MRLKPEGWAQIAGGILALGIAYGGMALGVFSFGRAGKVLLVVSVPVGVVFGWALIKILNFLHRILSESK